MRLCFGSVQSVVQKSPPSSSLLTVSSSKIPVLRSSIFLPLGPRVPLGIWRQFWTLSQKNILIHLQVFSRFQGLLDSILGTRNSSLIEKLFIAQIKTFKLNEIRLKKGWERPGVLESQHLGGCGRGISVSSKLVWSASFKAPSP